MESYCWGKGFIDECVHQKQETQTVTHNGASKINLKPPKEKKSATRNMISGTMDQITEGGM